MSAFAILLLAVGIVSILIGLISLRSKRPPLLSWGGIAIGVILIIGATVSMAQSSSETTLAEPAADKTTATSSPAAKPETAKTSGSEKSDLPLIVPTATPENLSELKIIHEFTTAVANFDGFKLVEVRAYGPPNTPVELGEKIILKLDQKIYVEFTVENLRKGPVLLNKTFVGAFDPRGENRSYGNVHVGVKVARFQKYQVGVTITLDQPGLWTLWPCYQLEEADETLRNRCTEKWQFFEITVEE